MNKVLREILDTVIYLAVVFILLILFITFVAQRTDVSGQSMENTLQDGDSLIVDKISYRFKDVVSPDKETILKAKEILGVDRYAE